MYILYESSRSSGSLLREIALNRKRRLVWLTVTGLSISAICIGYLYYCSVMDKRAKLALEQSTKAAFAVALKDNQSNIIFNAVPKSGSDYMAKTLGTSLKFKRVFISNAYIPVDQIDYFRLKEFYSHGSKICKQHFDASPLNIRILKRYTNKMVLNLRDPREILLSWVHHLNTQKQLNEDIFYVEPNPPEEYYQLSLSEQIDWNIKYFLPEIVKWMNDWLTVKQQEDAKKDGLQILLTTYDEFNADEIKFYSKILSFYNIPMEKFKYTPPPKDQAVHYRKGDSDEWRRVFTQQQKSAIAEIVPDSLLEQFNWKK